MRVKNMFQCVLPTLASGRFVRFGHRSHAAPPAPPCNVEEKCTEARAGRARFFLPTLSGGAGEAVENTALSELSHTGDLIWTSNSAVQKSDRSPLKRGSGIKDPWPYFLVIRVISGDVFDFPLVKARILVTELPIHGGVCLSEFNLFIYQYPYRSTFSVCRARNLGCFSTVVFRIC